MGKRWPWTLWILLLAAQATGTTLARMDLARLTAAATAIARARCLGNSSDWEAGEIWTRTRFQTLETWKGALPAEFTVRLIGGQVGGIESIVSEVPRFQPGEEVVLFLDPSAGGSYGVTAWTEGTFRVRRDRAGHAFVTQASTSEAVYNRATRQFRVEGIQRMALDQFRQRIRDLARSEASGNPPATATTGRRSER
jgi:hypothetical protein